MWKIKLKKAYIYNEWLEYKAWWIFEFNGYDILKDWEKVSAENAKDKAEKEYKKYKELKQKTCIDELKNVKKR